MQNDKIYSDTVTSLVRTRFEANLLLSELDVLERALFKTGEGDFTSTISSKIRQITANALEKLLITEDKENMLKNLRQKVKLLKYVHLTLAVEPTGETINKIFVWIKQNVDSATAIDIEIDKSILGGAIIEYQGKIKSFTVKQKVDEYFLTTHVNF